MALRAPGFSRAHAVGRWTRVSLSFQVVLVVLLAAGTALLAIEASKWRPLHVRLDLSRSGRNTLDPALSELIAKLPEPALVETFFQPLPGPFQQPWQAARTHVSALLALAERQHPEAFRLEPRDSESLETMRARLEQLGLAESGGNIVVVGVGERREVLRLFPDLAALGRDGAGEPRIASFRAELALAQALARASVAGRPRVLFSAGHGESDLFGAAPTELERLRAALEADGFELQAWNLAEKGGVPEDCEVFAVVGPSVPFTADELERLETWVRRGGRLLVALPSDLERGASAVALLAAFGMRAAEGLVCEPVLDAFGQPYEGHAQCAALRIFGRGLSSQHPVTAPLFERGRSVEIHAARSFEREAAPEGGVLLELLSSSPHAWRDLAQGGSYNFALDQPGESAGSFVLALAAEFPAMDQERAQSDEGAEIRTARVAGLGGALALSNATFPQNRDFLLNLFNWLAQREFRLNVSLEDAERGRIDVRRGTALAWVNKIGVWGLAGACALAGLATAWRRSR